MLGYSLTEKFRELALGPVNFVEMGKIHTEVGDRMNAIYGDDRANLLQTITDPKVVKSAQQTLGQ